MRTFSRTVDRWLEVVLGADVLTPRQIVGSGAVGVGGGTGERDRARPERATLRGLRRRHGRRPPDGAAMGEEDRGLWAAGLIATQWLARILTT